jgi:hypothetical protein
LPDLQDPQFELQIHMQGRPGEIEQASLDAIKGPDYEMTKGVSYDLSFMTQQGSSNRSRRMDRLYKGLDGDL